MRLRLGFGGASPCNSLHSSSSSSSSLTSSWIWLKTGALIRDVMRLLEEDPEEDLQRSTTWEGNVQGGKHLSCPSSSSSSSTLKRLGLRGLTGPTEPREPSRRGLEWGFVTGLKPRSWFCREGGSWPEAGGWLSCRWRRSGRAVLGLGPL